MTCARSLEGRAASEILRVVAGLGDGGAEARRSSMPGIVLARTALDPVLVPRAVRRAIEDEPWAVRHLHRVIPLQRWMPAADAGGIAGAAAEMAAAGIGAGKSYRITVEKRSSALSSRDIIARTAALIASAAGPQPPRVSLERPDRIVLVEIFGPSAGVSVLSPPDLLSAEREKRAASDAGDRGPLD